MMATLSLIVLALGLLWLCLPARLQCAVVGHTDPIRATRLERAGRTTVAVPMFACRRCATTWPIIARSTPAFRPEVLARRQAAAAARAAKRRQRPALVSARRSA